MPEFVLIVVTYLRQLNLKVLIINLFVPIAGNQTIVIIKRVHIADRIGRKKFPLENHKIQAILIINLGITFQFLSVLKGGITLVTLIIDRFESQWAVLEISAGKTFNFPINLLPKGAKEGMY